MSAESLITRYGKLNMTSVFFAISPMEGWSPIPLSPSIRAGLSSLLEQLNAVAVTFGDS